jgi:hypothetical protein
MLHEVEEAFSFNESDEKDILLSREQAQMPIICVKKRRRKRGRRSGCLLRIRRRASKHPLPSVLLDNMQSLENRIDDLRLRLSYQRDIKNCNILCFTESWLNDDTDNIELAGFSMHRQNRDATSGKTRDGGVCLFVNNSWCAKEVSRYCSPEVEYLMISCRPHNLPREFSSILFIVVYLPPQTDAGHRSYVHFPTRSHGLQATSTLS